MTATIYKPSRNVMQSGKAKTHAWVLEYDAETAPTLDPLMGYTSSADTRRQVRLRFQSAEDAENYARRNGIAYRLQTENPTSVQKVSYAENFRFRP